MTGTGSDRLDPSGSLPGLVSDGIGSVALSHVRPPLMGVQHTQTHTHSSSLSVDLSTNGAADWSTLNRFVFN